MPPLIETYLGSNDDTDNSYTKLVSYLFKIENKLCIESFSVWKCISKAIHDYSGIHGVFMIIFNA